MESGAKTQTIRKSRRYNPKEGGLLQLYTGQRTAKCRLLRVATCIIIEPIDIDPIRDRINVNGQELTALERHMMARADGFKDLDNFYCFFMSHYADLSGLVVIRWEYSSAGRADACASYEV